MKNFKAIIAFVFNNRRVIGTIVGLSLTLAGYPIGDEIVHLSSGEL